MKRVNLRDIATKANVSVATVSFALNGRGFVARKTAERVRAIAREMGYIPNPLLSSLASRKFRTAESAKGMPIAIFDFPTLKVGSSGRSDYSKMLVAEAEALGYAPKVHVFPSSEPRRPLFRALYHQMTQGIILTGNLDESLLGNDFDWNQFSVVQCARFVNSQNFHTVRPNIFQSVKLIFSQLLSRGYRRIGFGMGRHQIPVEDDESRHGAAFAMESGYLAKKDQLPVYLGPIASKDEFLAWVAKHRPDAVVGFSPAHHWFLRDAGYRIPEDIGFACLNIPNAEGPIRHSGLNQMRDVIAKQSVLLLDQLIRHGERGKAEEPMHTLISSRWVEGETLRPLGS